MGVQTLSLLAVLNAACAGMDQLAEAISESFPKHPDYTVITSFPGLADVSGARVLGEIGDDRSRFADARALKAYAGSAPVTRASGRSHAVTRRRIKNDRLAAVGYTWAFMAPNQRASGPSPTTNVAGPTATSPSRAPEPVQPDARSAAPLPADHPGLQRATRLRTPMPAAA